MKSVVGILYWGTTSTDGKSVTPDICGKSVPVAEGFSCEPNLHERFWVVEVKRFLRKPREFALPFASVGYAPIGQ